MAPTLQCQGLKWKHIDCIVLLMAEHMQHMQHRNQTNHTGIYSICTNYAFLFSLSVSWILASCENACRIFFSKAKSLVPWARLTVSCIIEPPASKICTLRGEKAFLSLIPISLFFSPSPQILAQLFIICTFFNLIMHRLIFITLTVRPGFLCWSCGFIRGIILHSWAEQSKVTCLRVVTSVI